MKALFSRKLSGDAEVRRIETLFERLPSGVVAAMIGVLLCFVVLFDSIPLEILKAWAAYMLSVLAMRVWIWYMFGQGDRQSDRIYRWEWAFAVGAFFSSLGWGALFGPLYPPPPHLDTQILLVLVVLVIVFVGTILFALSNITFWLFIIPTLLPAMAQYALVIGRQAPWPLTTSVCMLVVIVVVQRILCRSAMDNLQRSTEAETLLAEQQAIFDSSPMGIAVIDNNRVVKCNTRFGELMGHRIENLARSALDQHFASAAEAKQFLMDSTSAFDRGRVAQGMYRLRRADGSQFWAELSGRRMTGRGNHSVWMIADVTLRVAGERRSQPR